MVGQLMNLTEIWKETTMAQSRNSLDNWQDEVRKISIHFCQYIHKRGLHSDQTSSEKTKHNSVAFSIIQIYMFLTPTNASVSFS
jgi:hypothetical protein